MYRLELAMGIRRIGGKIVSFQHDYAPGVSIEIYACRLQYTNGVPCQRNSIFIIIVKKQNML
nr:unnamed protein product [Callosobruchus analis]